MQMKKRRQLILISQKMTPVKSRNLKKGKGGRKHEEQNSEGDPVR